MVSRLVLPILSDDNLKVTPVSYYVTDFIHNM